VGAFHSLDIQTFAANELGSYVGGQAGNALINHYTQSTSKPPARSTSQIKEDSLAPNDRHYITAAAAGQGKSQSPDFLAAYSGMDEGDDLFNMMMGIENTSNHPAVQSSGKVGMVSDFASLLFLSLNNLNIYKKQKSEV